MNDKVKELIRETYERAFNHPTVITTQVERLTDNTGEQWTNQGRPHVLLLDDNWISQHKKWIAFNEVGYGHDCVFNLNTHEIQSHNHGIFNERFCVLGAYYGYDRISIFELVEQVDSEFPLSKRETRQPGNLDK